MLALGVIVILSLPPGGWLAPGRFDPCLVCGVRGTTTALLNILFYVPLGIAAWWRWRTLDRAIGLGLAVSLAMELLQLVVPGRHSALSDLLANTAGAGLGALLAARPLEWIAPAGAAARRAAATAPLVAIAALIAPALLFTREAPAGPTWAQWKPNSGLGRRYAGEVIEARVGDLPLPSRRLEDPDAARRRLLAGDPVEVRFVAAPPPALHTVIFRVVTGTYGEGEDVLHLAVQDGTLFIAPRFRADALRLARPALRLDDALAHAVAGDTVRIAWRAHPVHGYEVRLDEGPPRLVGVGVARGWHLLSPVERWPEAQARLIDAVWLLAIAGIAGWFAIGRAGAVAVAVALLATAWSAPRWTDLLPTAPTALLPLVVGVVAGHALRRALTPRLRAAQRLEGAQTS